MLLLIVLLQGVRYLLLQPPKEQGNQPFQSTTAARHWLDSLKSEATSATNSYTYIYNPNRLSDYQGYMLGMTPDQIDRLILYRAQGNSINSPEEFQRVTGVSDSLLIGISPRLRFAKADRRRTSPPLKTGIKVLPLADINRATGSDLRRIKGIGPVLSERIVKFRNRLQGFQVNEQLYDVYGLDQSVADRVLQQYTVLQKPSFNRININQATARELAELIYLNWDIARQIIQYRELHGPFENLEELTKIEDFPSDKIDRIKLYLSL
ncbi:MAG: helix-hairpin-helix domain-containing protein [Eudoraea sp.]|nr:helix-hairpin-helix domain-containing protein [Eudoraea sp.]